MFYYTIGTLISKTLTGTYERGYIYSYAIELCCYTSWILLCILLLITKYLYKR